MFPADIDHIKAHGTPQERLVPQLSWPPPPDVHHPPAAHPLAPLSTRQVALRVALVPALVSVLAAWTTGQWRSAMWWYWALAAVVFVATYAAVRFGIERFVHQRIQALYRTVHELRRGRKTDRPMPRGDALGQVEQEVRAWVQERRTEIAELEEREKFRREFIGNLAHELKTPIFSVQGYILTLLEGGLEDERVNRDFLARASNGVDRLMRLVEDLDLITKLESGVMELRATSFDLRALVDEAIEALGRQADPAGVQLVNDVEAGTRVRGDRGRLAQVFTNLLTNAVIYGRPGGTCTVRAFPLGDQQVVEVTDDGIGIAAEHLPRLFERFYRVGRSRARHEGGSGLGLAIVKHIIEAHQQTITVRSTPGQGSTFSFTLQREEA
jgi:two-component system phosphate regulon sensor histidine kinase PhoR